jgi:pSer/pThr/pTyr-binding forkhead associated (FHA) protein/uncharacterized membrane protein YhaH (DUF805 family)
MSSAIVPRENFMFKLHLAGDVKKDHELKPGRNSIGRDAANDIVIDDEWVSGYHANIFNEDGQIAIVDLGSSNGTHVNGRPITGRMQLKAWDKIVLGDAEFEVVDPSARRPTRVQPIVQDRANAPTPDRSKTTQSTSPLGILEPLDGAHPEPVEIFGSLRIGRSTDNDLVLGQDTVSGSHAEIRSTADGLEVADLDSTNGTYVNGQRVTRKALKHGDRLRFDEAEFLVSLPNAAPAKTRVNPAIEAPTAKTRLNIAVPDATPTDTHQGVAPQPKQAVSKDKAPTITSVEKAASNPSMPEDEPAAPEPVKQSAPSAPTRIESAVQPPPVMAPPAMADDLQGTGQGSSRNPGHDNQQPGSGFAWLFFALDGRIGRMKFFFSTIGLCIAAWALLLALHAIIFGSPRIVPGSSQYFTCLLIAWAVTIYPGAALCVKRFHDQNRSGHLYWLGFIPIANFVTGIMLLFIAGTKGSNRFGPPPV